MKRRLRVDGSDIQLIRTIDARSDRTVDARSSRSMAGRVRLMVASCAFAFLGLCPTAAFPQSSLPDPSRTPGLASPAVTQATIANTICRSGYAAETRPLAWVTSTVKTRQLREAGVPDGLGGAYEEDHLIPLELGGAPTDERNLWPQPRRPADGWDASRKDDLEGVLHREVCAGRLSLTEAQRALTSDWHAAWRRFVPARAERIARPGVPGSLHGRGYYASTDGTEVHVPTVDAGDFGPITAVCVDGTDNFSHHRHGTCSHHGGVASWR